MVSQRPIPGYEGLYDVSTEGRVWSVRSKKWLKPFISPDNGYAHVQLSHGGVAKVFRIHRLVLNAFVGPLPAGMVTRHLNGCASDNRLANLRYGTFSENNLDAVRHGTHWSANRTHCPRKHPLRGANLRGGKLRHGVRECRACHQARAWGVQRELAPSDPLVLADADRRAAEFVPAEQVPAVAA